MTQLTDEELFAICGQNKGKTWLEGIRTIIAAHEQKLAAEYQQSCEPVAYAIFALMEGEWVPQYPIRFTRKEAEFDMVQYTRDSVLEIRPLYTHPQQDARDAEDAEKWRNYGNNLRGLYENGTILIRLECLGPDGKLYAQQELVTRPRHEAMTCIFDRMWYRQLKALDAAKGGA